MTALATTSRALYTMRRSPAPGEIGCVGACPLCSGAQGHPPCLACRDELRARVAEMRLSHYVEGALN